LRDKQFIAVAEAAREADQTALGHILEGSRQDRHRRRRKRKASVRARLPKDYRQVVVLRNLERRKSEDIAVVNGRCTGAVKKLWSRAPLQPKEALKDHERRRVG
jgi:DNA-directed RNA polymerase specialized sigma24 family protein